METFLHCNILCQNTHLSEMVGDPNAFEEWLPGIIDLSLVTAIRVPANLDGTPCHDQCAIHLIGGEYLIVDMTIQDVATRWMAIKKHFL
jgi:hypothetical protein